MKFLRQCDRFKITAATECPDANICYTIRNYNRSDIFVAIKSIVLNFCYLDSVDFIRNRNVTNNSIICTCNYGAIDIILYAPVIGASNGVFKAIVNSACFALTVCRYADCPFSLSAGIGRNCTSNNCKCKNTCNYLFRFHYVSPPYRIYIYKFYHIERKMSSHFL